MGVPSGSFVPIFHWNDKVRFDVFNIHETSPVFLLQRHVNPEGFHSGHNVCFSDALSFSGRYSKEYFAESLNFQLGTVLENLPYLIYLFVQRVQGYTRETMTLEFRSIVAVWKVCQQPLYQTASVGCRPAYQLIGQGRLWQFGSAMHHIPKDIHDPLTCQRAVQRNHITIDERLPLIAIHTADFSIDDLRDG